MQKMAAKAILQCRPNSHPFQDRTLLLDQAVKIGRSVARAKTSINNALFDCKVLSRNHAALWYSDGKFFLQDTKSSNGTFINNERLSETGEESAPIEVSSGDIVQFGVDVVENTRKVIHGCIAANLKLYLPDGKEAKPREQSEMIFSNLILVEDLYELHHYIQEASQRERLLETKLLALQEILNNIKSAADLGWKALIAEDCLLTRVEALESQLQAYSKNFPQDRLKDELQQLQDDKVQYQSTAKGFLKKILEEKLEATQKQQEVKRSLINAEAQCNSLADELAQSQIHIQELAKKLSNQISTNEQASARFEEIQEKHKEIVNKLEAKNHELEELLKEQKAAELFLEWQIRNIKGEDKMLNDKLSPVRIELQIKDMLESSDCAIKENGLSYDDVEYEQLKKSIERQKKCKEVVELITAQKEMLQDEKFSKLQQINNLQEEHDKFSIKHQNSQEECNELEAKIKDLESQVRSTDSQRLSIDDLTDGMITNGDVAIELKLRELKAHHNEVKANKKSYEINLSILKDNIIQAKDNLGKMSGNFLVTEEKLEKAQSEYEQCQVLTRALKEQLRQYNANAIHCENINNKMCQEMKQKKNEVSLVSENISREDNKTVEELYKLQEEYNRAQSVISIFEAEVHNLKEEISKLQEEKSEIKNKSDEPNVAILCKCTPLNSEKDELTEKVLSLEEKLVNLASKYMKCNEERSDLSMRLAKHQLEYEESIHQPYFNLFFALPCILLVLAIAFMSYPTLSHILGTADHPEDQSGPQ